MKIWFVVLVTFIGVYADAPLNLYWIDAVTRGTDFVKALDAAFIMASSAGASSAEVVIQTNADPPFLYAPGVVSGLIPYVQQSTFVTAPNSTLFIIPYNINGAAAITAETEYIVVGIEQIVTLAYRNTVAPPFPLRGFTSLYASSALPLYAIDPALRAEDIQSIANTFITSPGSFNGTANVSQLWILTTLNGPFYVPFSSIARGLIPNVTAISVLSNEFLLITYKPISFPFPWSVIVAADQVQQIVFYSTNPPPS